ncbi:MAG: hypothetical protein P8Y24_07760 [Gammaproteobacteria bacterium]
MSYKNIWEQHGIYRLFSGKLAGKELLESIQQVEADARFDSVRYVINNFLDVTEIDISPKDIKIIAAIDIAAALSNPHIYIAQVATDPQIEKLNELYSSVAGKSPYPTKVFNNLEDARKWLEELL